MSCYKSFIMEIRPRLQSCNVFLTFKSDISKKISIKLKQNEININIGQNSSTIQINQFNILVNSLSSLQINNSYAIFRFQTQNIEKTSGNFQSELLMFNTNFVNSSNENLIKSDTKYTIKCGNCENMLSKEICFRRVLPLPSENVEPSEWFCHKSDKSDITSKLNPNLDDCFFANCYVHLNLKILENIKLSTNSLVVCNRCFAWLGLNLKQEVLQLWFNTILFQTENYSICSNALNDFIKSTKIEMHDALLSTNKVLFECSNQTKVEYLCLWVLEKNLQLMVKGTKFHDDVITVAKVLFHFDSDKSKIINEWLNNSNISRIKISKPMMVSGLNHLYEMSNFIPKCYRMSNDFYVSYLIL